MRELLVQTNAERIQTEHKDMKDLEAVEKKEIHETKQVRLHSHSLTIWIPQRFKPSSTFNDITLVYSRV